MPEGLCGLEQLPATHLLVLLKISKMCSTGNLDKRVTHSWRIQLAVGEDQRPAALPPLPQPAWQGKLAPRQGGDKAGLTQRCEAAGQNLLGADKAPPRLTCPCPPFFQCYYWKLGFLFAYFMWVKKGPKLAGYV